MKIYMSFSQIPEFKNLSKREISRVSRIYYFKSFLHWRHWLAFGLAITCITIWYWIVEDMLPSVLQVSTSESISILLLIFWSALGGSVYFQIVTDAIRHLYCRDQNIKVE
jgi:hypothetical protein